MSQFCTEVDIVCLAVNIMSVVGVCVCVRKYTVRPAKNPEPNLQKLESIREHRKFHC